MTKMRLRITFAKTEAMRFTGHLDLHRTWERTLRRSGLPLAYSQGFNPRPKLNLASALPLGFTSEFEVADVLLDEEVSVPEIETALSPALPPGLQVSNLQVMETKVPSLQSTLESSEFVVTLLEPLPTLEARIQELLEAESLPRERRGKPYDLRPLILDLHPLAPDSNNHQRFFARLAATAGATGRPEEVIAALGVEPTTARVHRTRLIFMDPAL